MPRRPPFPILELCALTLLLWATTAIAADSLKYAIEHSTMPFFGTRVYTLASGIGGGFAAFAYAGEKSRAKLFMMAVVNGLLATALVTLAPFWLDWDWLLNMELDKKITVEPPMAFVLAFVLRWGVLLFIELGPKWVRKKWGDAPGEMQ